MATLYTIHAVDQQKLAEVVAEMQIMGSPAIRAVDCGDHLMAIEGTHRIAAAVQLGIAINLDILDQEDMVDADTLDWPDLRPGEKYTAGELAGEAYSPSCGVYRLNDDDNTVERI